MSPSLAQAPIKSFNLLTLLVATIAVTIVPALACPVISWSQQAKVIADDGAANDGLGSSVAIDGDTLVASAANAQVGNNAGQGAAYVFVRSAGIWTQQQKLTASDGAAGDTFGWSVAISGDTIVVGALFAKVGSNDNQGTAYVFVRSGAVWTQQAKLAPQLTNGTPDGLSDEMFGRSVSIDGDTVAVGAPQATNPNAPAGSEQAGAAYVFLRTATAWNIQQKIFAENDPGYPGDPMASPAQAGDNLGLSVSISGDTIVAGGDGFQKATPAQFFTFPGAVIVFARSGATWTEQQKVYASTPNSAFDGADGDQFGFSVSVSGSTFVAGSLQRSNANDNEKGAAYVYVLSGGAWIPQQKLTASDGASGDGFGASVSISGDTIVSGISPSFGIQGAAYTYLRCSGSWFEQQKLVAGDGALGDDFGFSTSISGNTIAAGAQGATISSNALQGAAYIYLQNTPTASDGAISGTITSGNGVPLAGTTISLSGTQSRETITDAQGNYHLDNVETNGFYTVTPSRANFVFSPAQRSFSQLGQNTDAAFNATATGNSQNPLDVTEYFVRQQYLDFLGREPDEAGFTFWVNNIEKCSADANCRAVQRMNTSAAFFLSIEFQQTGYLVYRMYQAAYEDMPGVPVPIKLGEFTPDMQEIGNGVIVNQSGWQGKLESNKQAFASEFAQRPRFTSLYAGMGDGQFVDTLNHNAGFVLSQSERDQMVSDLSTQTKTRAQVLLSVAENSTLQQQEFNQAFVLMQYFGYLRRDANTGPDTDFSGYNFWLNKLNSFGGNYQNAEMVNAFLSSSEYRGRFTR